MSRIGSDMSIQSFGREIKKLSDRTGTGVSTSRSNGTMITIVYTELKEYLISIGTFNTDIM